jgi:competence ComEA-like helix-hairpin-helix protein
MRQYAVRYAFRSERRRTLKIWWERAECASPLTIYGPDLYAIAAIDPWPSMRIQAWPVRGGPRSVLEFPREAIEGFFQSAEPLLLEQERVVEGVLAWVRDKAPHADIEDGWSAYVDVQPEPIDLWPEAATSLSPYRGQGSGSRIAERPAVTGYQAFLTWLGSSPDKPWSETPRELALTSEHLYFRTWKRKALRLPLSQLRAHYRFEKGDRIYVFGRRTRVVLPVTDKPCPVAQRLDELTHTRSMDSTQFTFGVSEEALDLNRATFEELVALPHVGDMRARQILELRRQRGGFKRPEEILAINGIGPKTFEELRELVTVGPRLHASQVTSAGEHSR